MTDSRPGKSNLLPGIQAPNPMTQVEGKTEDAGQVEHAMAAAVSEIKAINPQSLKEARQRSDWPKWQIAIQEELKALETASTWSIVERPENKNIVKNKWVFQIKRNTTGKVEQYKARLVAKGFTQVQGIDYYNMWAPMAKLRSIHFLLATAAQNGWPIDMFNFHSAFLNGELNSDKEVFMEQSQGYEESDKKQYVCKKQAGRKWYNALCKALASVVFK
jgi:Reverse transcriptase (RNA-dependent DNA polymerase)